jgi:hypothetical protein
MKMQMLACAVCLCAIAFQSCENNGLPEPVPVTEECPDVISYKDHIQPLINKSCALSGCHDGSLGEDRNWTIYSSLAAKKANVKDRINRPPGAPGRMPAVGELTQDEIETLTCWVNQGALNN